VDVPACVSVAARQSLRDKTSAPGQRPFLNNERATAQFPNDLRGRQEKRRGKEKIFIGRGRGKAASDKKQQTYGFDLGYCGHHVAY